MNKLAVFLKVKQESLALEAKYIKKQLRKHRPKNGENEKNIYFGLKDHLKRVVAVENRATNIARAYLRGKPYSFVEPKLRKQDYWKTNTGIFFFDPEWNKTWQRVFEIVRKYESEKAYNWYNDRRPTDDVSKDIISWYNKHPQFYGDQESV